MKGLKNELFETVKKSLASAAPYRSESARPFQVGPVDKLKRNGFLYDILVISTTGGVFYDGKTKRTNPDGNP